MASRKENEEFGAGMVDVGGKLSTSRRAVAEAYLYFANKEAFEELRANNFKTRKGDIFACASVAGILAAKKTSELLPHCHPLPICAVELKFFIEEGEARIRARAFAKAEAKTGVEMEALTALSISLLTLYDMCKAYDKHMHIEHAKLISKSGGKNDFDLAKKIN